MAVTIAADWALLEKGNINPSGRIVEGDLTDRIEAAHKAFAESTRIVSQGLYQCDYSTGRFQAESGAGYTERADHYIQHWSNYGKFQLHVYGQNVQVRATVGGQVVGVVTATSTLQIHSGTATVLSGITRAADGTVLVEIDAQGTGSGTERWAYFALEEVATPVASLPDADTYTSFQKTDSTAVRADYGYDGFVQERLYINGQELAHRTRGTARVWPSSDPITFSSMRPRCIGPILWEAAPGEESLSVVLYASATDEDIVVSAFTEFERDRFDEIRGDRAQTLTAGAGKTKLVFDGLSLDPHTAGYEPVKVWLLVYTDPRLQVADFSAAAYSPTTYSWWSIFAGFAPIRATDANYDWTAEDESWPVGLAILTNQTLSGLGLYAASAGSDYDTVRGSSGEPTERFYDLAHIKGGTTTGSYGEIFVSPNPRLVSPPDHDTQNGTVATVNCGYISLYSIWVAAEMSSAVARSDEKAAARVGEHPSYGVQETTRRRINRHTEWHTPVLQCALQGMAWYTGGFSAGVCTAYRKGIWSFMALRDCNATYQPVAYGMIPRNPVSGSGLNSSKLYARVLYLLIAEDDSYREQQIDTYWRIYANSVGGTPLTQTAPVYDPHGGNITISDVAAAATCQSVIAASNDIHKHSYIQQATDWGDVWDDPWILTEEIEIANPAALPCAYQIQMGCNGAVVTAGTRIWAVIAGVSLHYGRRV